MNLVISVAALALIPVLLALGAGLTGAYSNKPEDQHTNTIQHEKKPEGFGAEYLLLPLLF